MGATRISGIRTARSAATALFLLWASAEAVPPAPSASAPAREPRERAVFAMGCFWCAEAAFEGVPGIRSVISGYSGGDGKDATYEDVSAGRTRHRESIEVVYDPARIAYARLLDIFWRNVDPTQNDGQFCDHGAQYRAAVFAMNETQRKLAEASKQELIASKRFRRPVVTEVLPFRSFWPAEERHQDYFRKNPVNYRSYRLGCGRDKRLGELWGAEASKH